MGKYLGEFAAHSVQTHINVLLAPQYLELRTLLIQTLRRFPQARQAVIGALQQIESKAAANPTPDAATNGTVIDATPQPRAPRIRLQNGAADAG